MSLSVRMIIQERKKWFMDLLEYSSNQRLACTKKVTFAWNTRFLKQHQYYLLSNSYLIQHIICTCIKRWIYITILENHILNSYYAINLFAICIVLWFPYICSVKLITHSHVVEIGRYVFPSLTLTQKEELDALKILNVVTFDSDEMKSLPFLIIFLTCFLCTLFPIIFIP